MITRQLYTNYDIYIVDLVKATFRGVFRNQVREGVKFDFLLRGGEIQSGNNIIPPRL